MRDKIEYEKIGPQNYKIVQKNPRKNALWKILQKFHLIR